MTRSRKSGPGRRHTDHAIGDTGGIDNPGVPVLKLITTNPEVLAHAGAGDALRYHVFVQTSGRPRAVCGCGWSGRKRLIAAGARLDAWLHAAQALHIPATPLTR
jgi:hypothetical protein